jgi:hypothetical protein
MARLRLLLVLLTLASSAPASAKAQDEVGYRVEEIFSTALRYVRVDRGCKVTDKDPDAAFVLFECPIDDKRTSRGAIEIFRAVVRGKEAVRLSVALPDEPHGAELRLLELLERKLREERGTPQRPAPPPATPAPSDGGVRQ